MVYLVNGFLAAGVFEKRSRNSTVNWILQPAQIGIKFLKNNKTLYELYPGAKRENFIHSNFFNDHKSMPEESN